MGIKVGKLTLITLMEAQRKFGVSRVTLRRAINRGEIKVIAQNKNATYVKPEDVKRWIERHYRADMAERVRKRWEKEKPEVKSKRNQRA